MDPGSCIAQTQKTPHGAAVGGLDLCGGRCLGSRSEHRPPPGAFRRSLVSPVTFQVTPWVCAPIGVPPPVQLVAAPTPLEGRTTNVGSLGPERFPDLPFSRCRHGNRDEDEARIRGRKGFRPEAGRTLSCAVYDRCKLHQEASAPQVNGLETTEQPPP